MRESEGFWCKPWPRVHIKENVSSGQDVQLQGLLCWLFGTHIWVIASHGVWLDGFRSYIDCTEQYIETDRYQHPNISLNLLLKTRTVGISIGIRLIRRQQSVTIFSHYGCIDPSFDVPPPPHGAHGAEKEDYALP